MNITIRIVLTCIFIFASGSILSAESPVTIKPPKPKQSRSSSKDEMNQTLRVGVVGLVHTHVHWILGRKKQDDIEIVGIVEPNRELAKKYSLQHGYSMDIVFDSLDEMVRATKPEAVTAFNTIHGHLEVVEYCAPKGIHVMVEKPLAASLVHAQRMAELAKAHNIELLTNYETSWYRSTYEAARLIREEKALSGLRKINFYTGHQGPIEIGCNPEFVEWLIDPKLNGGGALTDFGCYGANIATWLLDGQTPQAVSCVTRQSKPDLYPNVEDDATIVIDYVDTQVLIQASWNWSHNRKEMELFCQRGCIQCRDGKRMTVLLNETPEPKVHSPRPLPGPHDPFNMLQKVIKEDLVLSKFDVSSLDNNLIVMQILEAAKKSAKEGRRIKWDELKTP